MLLLEIIIIAAVIVALFAQVDKLRANRRSAADASKLNQVAGNLGTTNASAPAAHLVPAPIKLRIEGTKPFSLKNAAFFGQFGVPVKRLADACQFVGPGNVKTFPAAVSGAVCALYDEGTAVGPEIMRLICHDRELSAGEALYFALTRTAAEPPVYTMYAFLDKVRA